jgi:hypothetical protein
LKEAGRPGLIGTTSVDISGIIEPYPATQVDHNV